MPSDGGGALSAVAYNGLIYTFGGSTYSPWASRKTVFSYDPQTDIWTKKQDMPTGRFALQTCLVNGKIYAISGGQYDGGCLSVVEVYDPITDTWETKPNMPISTAWATGAVVNEKIYVFGKMASGWSGGWADVWEYDPAFNTPVAAGNVSGTWTLANSPYHINGEITVPNAETLTIEPGVGVVFTGHHKFNVQGRLMAVGTAQNPILFTAENKTAGWHGVRFINTPGTNDTFKIAHCSFKYGKANTGSNSSWDRCGGAVFIRGFDNVLISNSLFEYNMTAGDLGSTGGPGVCIFDASPTVTKCTFKNNDGSGGSAGAIKVDFASQAVISHNTIINNTSAIGAVICAYQSSNQPTISGNIISNNVATTGGGGVFVWGNAKPRIENNIITHNQAPGGGGIYCGDNANAVLINNTIAYNSGSNGGGIYFESNSDGIFINNILYGNSASSFGSQVFINDAASDPYFMYNDIEGGKEDFGGSGATNYDTVRYANNIAGDPLFMHAPSDNYLLSNYSPCIGAGTNSILIQGVTYYAPHSCFYGGIRPNPFPSDPDIGACENPLDAPTDVEQDPVTPTEFLLYQNYPNPFNPTTNIEYRVGSIEYVTLKVFDILGNEVATLVNEEKSSGSYEVTWNATGLSSGVYFYQLKAGSYVETKKMILLR